METTISTEPLPEWDRPRRIGGALPRATTERELITAEEAVVDRGRSSCRRQDGELTTVSLRGQLAPIRAFLKFCERIDAVAKEVRRKVGLPDAGDSKHRDAIRDAETDRRVTFQGYLLSGRLGTVPIWMRRK